MFVLESDASWTLLENTDYLMTFDYVRDNEAGEIAEVSIDGRDILPADNGTVEYVLSEASHSKRIEFYVNGLSASIEISNIRLKPI